VLAPLLAVLVSQAAALQPRPTVGLALSGGGARGGAHIGVLRVLEELRVPVDNIAGTSMGAIIGGLYCAGHSPDELDGIVRDIDWDLVFRDAPERKRMSFRRKVDDDLSLWPIEIGIGRGPAGPSGLTTASRIEFFLRSLTLDTVGIPDFDALPVPFRAIAADLDTGDAVVLGKGELALALRASMSIPGAFTPVEIGGRMLVDGGIAMNLPVEVVQEMGVEVVIAVDVGTPPRGARKGMSPVGVYVQTFGVLLEENVERSRARLDDGDVLIEPDLGEVRVGDFEEIARAIAAGEAAARAAAPELHRYSVSAGEYEQYLKRQRRGGRDTAPITIDEVVVEGVTHTRPDVVQRRVRTAPGDTLDPEVLMHDLDRVSQAGEFESVGFRVEEHDGDKRLVIQPREKSWGPGYLRFGSGLQTDFRGDNEFRLLAVYRRAHVNRLGAEWKTETSIGDPTAVFTELFQPLEATGFLFVAPSLLLGRDREEQFVNGQELEVLDTFSAVAGLDVGVQVRNYGELRLGVFGGDYDAEPRTETVFPGTERDLGFARLRATLDQVDSANFPTRGNRTQLDVELSRAALGADDEYDRLALESVQAWTWGRNTFVGAVEVGSDLDSDLPFYREFQLGGFLRLSGLEPGQLQGDVSALFTLADYWRLGKLGQFGKLYAGAAVQAGNVWDTVDDFAFGELIYSGTLYFGVDTWLSPVYLGYGLAEDGARSAYMFMGRPFGRRATP
jgi:NTE family protein